MLGLDYESVGPVTPKPGQGRVARYAWGTDYHTLIRRRLRLLEEFLLLKRPGARVRGVVDTAPLLERDFAHSAGLGWFGKNTMLINKQLGSWLFLAALLTDVPGCSHAFERGFVVYSKAAKCDLLGLDRAMVENCGAVSKPVAVAMA